MAEERQPLVLGGILQRVRYEGPPDPVPASFTTRAPPIIEKDTIIVAVASPDTQYAHDQKDAWFISDFYAFNYLLKGLGRSQTWFTAAEPQKLVEKYGNFLHGNEFQGRKVVLSRELLESSQITPVTIVKPAAMVDRFLEEVRRKSAEAARENCPLLLMVFCHGLSNHRFLLNTHDHKKGLSAVRLKEAIADRCRATLLSTACHSGGWAATNLDNPAHDPLNVTMLAAADQSNLSHAWQVSHSPRQRSCGSIFASSVIEALSSATDSPEAGNLQQPEDPTWDQAMTYNAFCQSILDHCRDGVHRLWERQFFTFSAQDDDWSRVWNVRTGFPLEFFRERWNKLENVPYSGSPDTKARADPHPSNTDVNPEWMASLSLTGGGQAEETDSESFEDERHAKLMHGMTYSMCNNRVSQMAKLFLETCPNDWSGGYGPGLCRMLMAAAAGTLDPKDTYCDIDVPAFIDFRWHLAAMADYLVLKHNLPKPNNEVCIMWQGSHWIAYAYRNIRGFSGRYRNVSNLFESKNFNPEPTTRQGPSFERFANYMAAAVALTKGPEDVMREIALQLVAEMEAHKLFYQQIGAADETNIAKRKEWMKSIGR